MAKPQWSTQGSGMPARCFIFLGCFCRCLLAATPEEWQSRAIYFLITDRFSRGVSHDGDDQCAGEDKWCGGNFLGIIEKLDYIQGMGYDALWITPVVRQVDLDWGSYGGVTWTSTGYHGYWAKDLTTIDPHYGTADDLKLLAQECHRRGMYLMVDVVVNHVGPLKRSIHHDITITPFNQPHHYHQLGRLAGETFEDYIWHACNSQATPCFPGDYSCFDYNQTWLELCWFQDLGDLDQGNPEVSDYLKTWGREMVANYSLDGMRMDTAAYVDKAFLKDFHEATDTFIIAEVTTKNISYFRGYQEVFGSLLHIPQYWAYQQALQENNMSIFAEYWLQVEQGGYRENDVDVLGNFVDNHDQTRFLAEYPDEVLLKNNLALITLQRGIPVLYYGTEQGFDSIQNRVSLWPHFDAASPLYMFIKALNELRQQHILTASEHIRKSQRMLYHDRHTFAFRRADLVVVINNLGSNAEPRRVCMPYPRILACASCRWAVALGGAGAKATLEVEPNAPNALDRLKLCIEAEDGHPVVLAAASPTSFLEKLVKSHLGDEADRRVWLPSALAAAILGAVLIVAVLLVWYQVPASTAVVGAGVQWKYLWQARAPAAAAPLLG